MKKNIEFFVVIVLLVLSCQDNPTENKPSLVDYFPLMENDTLVFDYEYRFSDHYVSGHEFGELKWLITSISLSADTMVYSVNELLSCIRIEYQWDDTVGKEDTVSSEKNNEFQFKIKEHNNLLIFDSIKKSNVHTLYQHSYSRKIVSTEVSIFVIDDTYTKVILKQNKGLDLYWHSGGGNYSYEYKLIRKY
jgi:hypothetical protein